MGTDQPTSLRIASQFLRLSQEQRQKILKRMGETGQSFRLLPIVSSRDEFPRIPLSYAQQRLLFLWQLEPDNTFYNVPSAVQLKGELNVAALQQTFDHLVLRHESLRTRFMAEEGDYFQLIDDKQSADFQVVDVPDECRNSSEQWVKDAVEKTLNQSFDLMNGPLLRIKLFRLKSTDHVLTVCMHHIISDGWSSQLLIEEFAEIYNALVSGVEQNLPELPIQYADYAIWQRSWLEAGEGEKQLTYWRNQLGDDHTLLTLPFDFERPDNASYCGAKVPVVIPQPLAVQLQHLARNKGYTLFMLMTAALAVVLSRFSGQSDIRIGAPNAGRNHSELARLVGFFINTQVLRVQVDECKTFAELLEQVKSVVSGAQSHQDLPFEQLVDELVPERNLTYNSLFQVKINQNVTAGTLSDHRTDNNKDADAVKIGNLSIEGFPLAGDRSHFDLAFDFTVSNAQIFASFTYATDLFRSSTIEQFSNAYKTLLAVLVQHFDQPILYYRDESASIPDTQSMPLEHVNYLTLWQQGCRLGGVKPALRFNEQTLTYDELNRQTDQLARYLHAQGISPGKVVGVCLSRSIEWVVSILAIMKAGAVYLPLDDEQPIERLQYFLEDSGAEYVIHHRNNEDASQFDTCQTIAFSSEQWSHLDKDFVAPTIYPQQAAYIIYTSGSTGQPKGVTVSHRSLVNYVEGLQARLQLMPEASMAIVSTIAADLGHTMLFSALAYGRLLHLLSHGCAFDPDAFANYMAEHQVGILKIVPSHLHGLLHACQPEAVLPQQALILGGEICSWKLVEQIRQLSPSCRVINHYGPTESTVGVSTYEVDTPQEGLRSVPIGQSLPNSALQIVDDYLNPVPVRVAGELYIGGTAVAQGYLGKPALSAERFVPNPMAEAKEGERCYRTGDRVRLVGGLLEFQGRADDQVKIRGYRVEPSEVASALKQVAEVQDAVVQAMPVDGDPTRLQLVAYCVLHSPIYVEQIQTQLRASLPEHMAPSSVLILEKFPLTANGKLDRKALPGPCQPSLQAYEAPQGKTEQILADVWAEVLGVEQVSRNDSFFALGGDSILSLKVIARARKRGINLLPQQVFENPVLSDMVEVGRGDKKLKSDNLGRVDVINVDPPISLMKNVEKNLNSMPLYCVVPWRGNVDYYDVLSEIVGKGRNVYGLTCSNVDRFKSIEDLALYYLEHVRSIQKKGPYAFVGWSLSCITVMHMANVLEKQGEKVHFLGLIDSFLPGKPNRFLDSKLILRNSVVQHFSDDKAVVSSILKLADQYFNGLSAETLKSSILDMEILISTGISHQDLILAIDKLIEYLEKEKLHDAIRGLPALNVIPHAYWADSTGSDYVLSFLKLLRKPPISCTIKHTDHQTIVKDQGLASRIDRDLKIAESD